MKKEEISTHKVYLSGAITSDPDYKTHFKSAAKKLTSLGYAVFDPTTISADTYEDYLRRGLAELLVCNYIYYVNDVTTSKGVLVEKIVAESCGIRELRI